MLLYECVGAPKIMEQYLNHPGAACGAPSMPRLWELCVSPTVAWAVSSAGAYLPLFLCQMLKPERLEAELAE